MPIRTAHHWALNLVPQAGISHIAGSSFLHGIKSVLLGLNRRIAGLRARSTTAAHHALHYLDGGQGEPVLLLHGLFAEKDHWVDLARRLTPHHRVVVPDLPGFGASDRLDDAHYGYAEQVERLRAFMDSIGLQRAHVAGSSMGGALGAMLAREYPNRVASLAFIGAPHGLRSPKPSETDLLIDGGHAPLVARNSEEFDALFERLFHRPPRLPWPLRRTAREEAIRLASSNLRLWAHHVADRYLLEQHIAHLCHPMLVLWGRRDRIFHVSGVRNLRWRCPHAEVQVLERVGHLPMMEAPDAVAERYRNFLLQHRWMKPRTP
ncbi:MAG: alpha/beta fold hydrolase [Hydrogenophaga sp.]|uniref:alpha/beta fold hydrolase n=1 Tax=Hydrogenophaga sp. TaxID=1904254 RepID=UPI001D58517E|nr:alpha/beta fold hydrolase [Hydrogenophaga sp.]MBX3611353.1 alpha/beta fold hydrolase [Hydrogenophaga sp.]